jgi:hypothetical protein
MISKRDKKVLIASLYVVMGVFAFLIINYLLLGRISEVIRLGLGVWVVQLITYPAFEDERRIGFAKWALRSTLYIIPLIIIYSLIKYLWQHF